MSEPTRDKSKRYRRGVTMSLSVGLILWISVTASGEPVVNFEHGPLRVSQNQRFLVHEDGTPFFYLGDTAWELFHRLNDASSNFPAPGRKF